MGPERAERAFYWGTATAAYQVEGSPMADGAGRCVWHEFSHTPGTVHQGDNGDIAADHYHLWRQDIALMKQLGMTAYRFSLRWPRVLPEGAGAVNSSGLGFYDRLVDALLEAGLEPFPTLFHWDFPSALHARGGWYNRDAAGWFADYCSVVVRVLGDRVRWWTTLNEPFVVAEQGHLVGAHAPGMRNVYATAAAVHNQLRAHVAGQYALKAIVPEAKVGLALHNVAVWPATSSDEDYLAAETANAWHNYPLFLDPLVFGRYPQELEHRLAPFLPAQYERDMEAMVLRPDFAGLNYYFGYPAKADESQWLGFAKLEQEGVARTSMGWAVRPDGLHQILCQAHDRCKLPALFVTENGAAFDDVLEDGAVHDPSRTDYLKSHVAAVLRARQEGVPVRGYFAWSLLDNFEWALGYSQRFGIVYVDYATQARYVKDSGLWYSEMVRREVTPEAPATATS